MSFGRLYEVGIDSQDIASDGEPFLPTRNLAFYYSKASVIVLSRQQGSSNDLSSFVGMPSKRLLLFWISLDLPDQDFERLHQLGGVDGTE